MQIKPLRSHEDFVETVNTVAQLIDSSWPKILTLQENSQQYQEYEVLCTLIEIYERENCLSEFSDPIEAVRFYMERYGLNILELSNLIAEDSLELTDILNRIKPITLSIIWKLCTLWKIPAKLLLKPYQTYAASKRTEPEPEYTDRFTELDEPHAYFP
ncbi:MAG: hypothetical protein K2W94_06595 [Alphaproteobacteria bacterium]|nr:hypothetical protein [Alphaproteobacteria bacterium]